MTGTRAFIEVDRATEVLFYLIDFVNLFLNFKFFCVICLLSFRLSDIQDCSCFCGHFDNFSLLFVDDPLSAFIISTIEACKGMVIDASSAVPYFLYSTHPLEPAFAVTCR